MSGKRLDVDLGSATLIPSKEALRSLRSDVTREQALKELCDNAIDAWTRNTDRMEPLTIEVFAERHEDEERTELVIRDDSGGVTQNNAGVVFQMGGSAKTNGLIGTYGLGATKGLMSLGVPFTIASHHDDEDFGWSYTITDDWFEDDDWDTTMEVEEDIEPGVTELRVHDLDYPWFTDKDDSGITVPERVRREFAGAYNYFLADELRDEAYDLTIEVQGEEVEPLSTPEWAYSPFDGIFPRRFENIEIDLDGMATTEVAITVGHLHKSDTSNAGIDVYIQDRQVGHALRGEEVGFGIDMKEFGSHDERFKAIVELKTDGDAQDLPWDTQKTNLDTHNRIMKEIRNWLRRTCSDYIALPDGKVPSAFVEPYTRASTHAANDGEVVTHDFSDRYQVQQRFKPDTDLPEVTGVMNMVEAHAALRFAYPVAVDAAYEPAYKQHLDKVADGGYSSLEQLTESPVELELDKAGDIASQLEELVERHVEESIRYPDDLIHWQQPKYTDYYETAAAEAEFDPDDAREPEKSPSDIPTTLEELESSADEGESAGTGTEAGTDTGTGSEPGPDEQMIEVALRVFNPATGAGAEAVVKEIPRSEAIDRFRLDDDATRDDIAAEVTRRVDVALEM